jgi:clan AA aspartic protease (TIGR02281 family)
MNASMNLPAYLKSLGYLEVPFTVTRVNHIVVHARVNGEDVVLIVDTGASRTCIAETSAERLGLTPGRVEKVAVSFALPKKTRAVSKLKTLDIGSLHLTNVETWLVDFSYINMIVQMKGEEFCDGVLGADILKRTAAVIDYRCCKMYLKGA